MRDASGRAVHRPWRIPRFPRPGITVPATRDSDSAGSHRPTGPGCLWARVLSASPVRPYHALVSSPIHGTNPELTVAIALAAGVLMQILARHLRIPGIVLLLLAGVILGPDALGLIDPSQIQGTVHGLVSFAVAVILFEGGMNMNLQKLRREARVIRLLVSSGAIVTGLGGTLVAKMILGWEWQLSILFGTLVIVTGPTVITPLLRRIRVRTNIETILEAEGVFIDAVGAILAVVTLQIALQSTAESSFADGLVGVFGRLAIGMGFGLVGGGGLALLLRPRRLVPEGLENILVLGVVLFLFQLSHSILPESGIGTVTVAGVVVGNVRSRVSRELLEFKEQLTVLFIGLLFILLAADVRLADVQSLGARGVYAVLGLMFLVRPVNILASTWGSNLTWREKFFLSWLAPRGIVAAAVASIFAQALRDEGMAGGAELRSMVFLVIAGTVLVQGLTGGLVARILGLSRPSDQGYAILGANDLGRAVGRALSGEDRSQVVFMDSNVDASKAAEEDGFRVIYGNALEESSMVRAQMDSRYACIAVTTNEEVNLLFARRATEEFKVRRLFVALQFGHGSVTEKMARDLGANVLFGRERDLELWDVRFRRGTAALESWQLGEVPSPVETVEGAVPVAGLDDAGSVQAGGAPDDSNGPDGSGDSGLASYPDSILPLSIRKGSRRVPISRGVSGKKGDQAWFAIFVDKREEAETFLRSRGWEFVPADAATAGQGAE